MKFKRNCPDCNRIIIYSNISVFNFKTKHNKPCRDCSYKRRIKPKNFKKKCPICENDIFFTNKGSYLRSVKSQSNCKPCAGFIRRGQIVSEETKKKMRDNHYDASGSNNPNFGKISVNRGKRIEEFMSEENVIKNRQRLSKGLYSGFKHSEESKKKISDASTGEKNGFYGKKHSPEVVEKSRIRTLKMVSSKNNTKPELIFESYLKELNLKYEKQKIIAFWSFDFYLEEYNTYIEIDGDYWHANPKFFDHAKLNSAQKKNIGNDKRKKTYTEKNNLNLLRFWENDVIKNKQFVLDELLKIII